MLFIMGNEPVWLRTYSLCQYIGIRFIRYHEARNLDHFPGGGGGYFDPTNLKQLS